MHLISGNDESLVIAEIGRVVDSLIGDTDRALVVDDFDTEEYEMRAVVDAAQTPPFLSERRVVVARGVGRFTADDIAPLVAYLQNPLEYSDVVIVGGGGRLPKALSDALKAAQAVVHDTSPPTKPGDRASWLSHRVAGAGIKLDGEALRLVGASLGEDVGRLEGLLETLAATYGTARTLRSADVAPYVGDGGGVPPWDLTDAIDAGNTSLALALLQRMLRSGDRHPLQVMAVLHGHYGKLLALDGLDVRDEAAAAGAMGIKPGYPVRKALEQYRRLGGQAVCTAIRLLAQADLDLRGAKDLPEDLVLEVLVARLSRLGRRR